MEGASRDTETGQGVAAAAAPALRPSASQASRAFRAGWCAGR